jgi:hypothetical protein
MELEERPGQPVTVLMSHPVTCFADRLHEVLDEVTMVSTAGLSGEEAGHAAVRLARAEARLAALRLRLLDKADRADVGEATASATAAWWAQAATVDRSRARRDVRLAGWLTGDLHRTEVALAAGDVSAPQAEVIVDAVRALPASAGPDGREKAELHMLELARRFGPKELKVLGARLLDVIDPDHADARLAAQLEKDERAAARRCFLEMYDDDEGTTHGRFAISTLVGDMLRTALNAFASPRRPNGYEREDTGGTPRPNAVLLGQAFTELVERYPADRVPQSGGVNATLIVTIPVETLLGGLKSADLLTGHQLSPGEARRLACEAGLLPEVLGGDSRPLDHGRERRFHSTGQRKVIQARDRTCRAEGCDVPANWCHVHHLSPWARGGQTSVDDAVSLCARHHTRAHDPTYETTRTSAGRLRFSRIRQ